MVYDLTKQKWHFSEENANYEFGTKKFKYDLICVIIWPFQVLFKSKWLSDRKSQLSKLNVSCICQILFLFWQALLLLNDEDILLSCENCQVFKGGVPNSNHELKVAHCVPKMLKSQPWGAGPKFMYHVKGGYVVISKNIIFFKSVQGKN